MSPSEKPGKQVKRLVRELADRAYAEALGRELSKLHDRFHVWQEGRISPFDLADEIHTFHQGPNRELYAYFTGASQERVVAEAVVEGLIPEASLPADVQAYLARDIAFAREHS
jgi:hypothetical protein